MKNRHCGIFFSSFIVIWGILFLCLGWSLGVVTAAAQASNQGMPSAAYQKLLTVGDVESATEIKGVKLIPRDYRKGAGGDLNFAKPDGSMLLMVHIGNADLYQQWKAQKATFNSAVSGIGDEAYCGPNGMAPYVLYVRKGNHSLSLASFLNSDTMKPLLTQDQLRSMAKVILSRL